MRARCDVEETEAEYRVTLTLPGVDPTRIEVECAGAMVRVAGARFERFVAFPSPVDRWGARAAFREGFLIVTVPKAAKALPRAIPVRAFQPSSLPPPPCRR